MTKYLNLDIDSTLGGDNASDSVIASQKAIKTYIDNKPGGGSVETVNNVSPDGNGNVTLTASDVGALPDSTSIPTTTNSVTSGSSAALTSGGAYTNLVTKVEAGTTSNTIKVTKAGSASNITINDVAHATAADSATNATSATTASKLGSSDVGSTTQPIYLDDGEAKAISYTISKNVPLDAEFTDTKNTAGSTDTSSKIFLVGATSQAANPQTYSHDTAFVDANGRLNSAAPASNANDTTVATTKWVKDQGYTTNTGTVTKVNNTSPDSSGNVTLNIPSEVTETTVSGWGFTKNTGTVTSVNNTAPVNGNVTLSLPAKISDLTDDTSTYPIDKADTLTGLTATITELNYTDGVTSAIQTQLDNKIATKPDGSNTLISNNKISTTYIPDFILGQMLYAGTFVPSTAVATLSTNAKTKLGTTSNTITLTNNTTAITGYKANEGNYYICSADGTFASISFLTGDWLVSTGSSWKKIDNTDAVTGIKGNAESTYRTGNVNITADNVLPAQSGNSGKFLTTNGSASSWAALSSTNVTTALGFTPYDSSNPAGYTSNVGTVTKVNNTSPDSSGNVTLSISDTKDTAGAANSTSKLYLVGRTAQSTGTSNSNSAVYTQNGYLYATTPSSTQNDTTVATTKFVKDQGYKSSITSSDISTALGFTPANYFAGGNISIDTVEKVTLPSGYTQVAYIEGTGTQYIDTGWKFSNTYPVKIDCKFIVNNFSGGSGGYPTVYGLQTSAYTNWVYPFYINAGNFNAHLGGSAGIDSVPCTLGQVYDTSFTINNGTWARTINGSSSSGSWSGTITTAANMFLGGGSYGSNPINQLIGKIFSFKITVNGSVVRNYIPCKRNSDGVAGMYDLATSTFKSSGSGSFLMGSAVTASGDMISAIVPTKISQLTNDKGYVTASIQTLQSVTSVTYAASQTITLTANSSIYKLAPTGNITSMTFSLASSVGASATTAYTFELYLDISSTLRSVAFPTSSVLTWQDGEIPDLSETGVYLFAFRTMDGGTHWIGNLQGKW